MTKLSDEMDRKVFKELEFTMDCFIDGLVGMHEMHRVKERLAEYLDGAEGDLKRSAERAVMHARKTDWPKQLRYAEKIPTWLAAWDMVGRKKHYVWAGP